MTVIVFLPPAQEEVTAAAQYYQTQSTGLETEFLAEENEQLLLSLRTQRPLRK
jgi:hypothetical protein